MELSTMGRKKCLSSSNDKGFCADSICLHLPLDVKVGQGVSLSLVSIHAVSICSEVCVDPTTTDFGKKDIQVGGFGEIIQLLVDSFAAQFGTFLSKTEIGLAAQGNDSISLKLNFEQAWCSLVKFCSLGAAGRRNPGVFVDFGEDKFVLVFVTGCCWEPRWIDTVELFSHFWFDGLFQGWSRQSHVKRVCIHFAELVIFSVEKSIHKIKMELQHPQFGVLVDKKSNLQGQVPFQLGL